MKYIEVKNFVVKLRAYPTKEQAEKIDKAIYGVGVAYNVTAKNITECNPDVTKPKKDREGFIEPNFPACSNKKWLDWLVSHYPVIGDVPRGALSSSAYGVFTDLKRAYKTFHPEKIPHVQAKTKTGMPKFRRNGEPVWEKTNKSIEVSCEKWKPERYTRKHPRTSFTVQTGSSAFRFSPDSKTVYVGVTNMGKVKCRGWRHDLRYGQGDCTFQEFYRRKENVKKAFGVTVSKDNCGDYWITVKLQTVWKPVKEKSKRVPIGIDVGIKDIAITSDGKKYGNEKFKYAVRKHKKQLNRMLSRRQGWANIKFREAHQDNKDLKPSKNYESTKLKLAKLERKVARRRENRNHVATMDIVSRSNFIGIESLNVKGMMKNRRLTNALSDAAMYDVLSKLQYKANWNGIPVQAIGRWVPSSKTCHVCGYKKKDLKLKNRDWICPSCGTHLDRDINAALNILAFAQKDYEEQILKTE